MLIVYTLSTCDTCKKALKWLAENDIQFENRDIRRNGINPDIIQSAIAELGWQKVLNRRSTSWRNLSDGDKEGIDDVKAAALIVTNSILMKRPLFNIGDRFIVGFDDNVRAQLSV